MLTGTYTAHTYKEALDLATERAVEWFGNTPCLKVTLTRATDMEVFVEFDYEARINHTTIQLNGLCARCRKLVK